MPARLAVALILAAVFVAPPLVAKPPKAEVPPPPGLKDPTAVSAPTPASAPDPAAPPATATAEPASADPMSPPPKPDARLVRDKASREASAQSQRIAGSQVTRRMEGEDTVEEFRDNGRIWMVKITPKNGPTQTFTDTDGSGKLSRDPKAGPISPVYYTIYEWK